MTWVGVWLLGAGGRSAIVLEDEGRRNEPIDMIPISTVHLIALYISKRYTNSTG